MSPAIDSMIVLVVAADGRVWEFVHDVLVGDGHVVDRAEDGADALGLLALRAYDLLVVDLLAVPAGRSALPFALDLRRAAPRARLVLVGHSRGREALPADGPDVIRLTVPMTEGDLRAAVAAGGR